MNRRDVLVGAATGAAALSLNALAQAPAGKAAPAAAAPAINTALYDAALACIRAGQVCLDHCVRTLSTGDKSMAECAATVRAMLPLCTATADLAVQKSSHLKALAAVCAKACRDCEAACKKHANHHAECKACMESCQKCAAECEKAAA
ncbi:MAG: Csp1 family four helix bundle copper storage protein [Myxococcota bacterium]